MTQVIADTEVFGNVLPDQAAAIAATLHGLKVDFSDLQSLISRTQSFEGAADAAHMLAMGFNASIDPVQLMRLSLTDQAAALQLVREALIEAGHSTQSLSRDLPRQNALMEIFGASSTDFGLRLLDQSVAIDDLMTAAGEASEKSSWSKHSKSRAIKRRHQPYRSFCW